MTEKVTESGGSGGRDAADLTRALAERERQLRDLTEQALGFLEELAESRRHNRNREQLVERLGDLERNLVDARSRLRHAGIAAATPAGGSAVPLEVVCWGEGARARAAAVRAATAGVPVTWITVPEGAPADDEEPRPLVHRDACTEAQCWNLGMAASHGTVVLFLGPGASMEQDAPLPLPAALPHVAILCPRVVRQGREEIGCEETDDLLHLKSRPPASDQATPAIVPFPSADAFLLRRAAFEHVGLFDEGLTGPATLLDWVFRARTRNLEVVAAPEFAVTGALELPAAGERGRLRVLARHRPTALGRALAGSELLSQVEPSAARDFLHGVLAELPAGDLAVQRAALDAIALGLVAGAMPPGQLAARLQAIRIALLQPLAEAGFAAGQAEAKAALQEARSTPPSAADALTALERDLDLDRRIRSAMLAELAHEQSERRRLDGEYHAQLARAERADGALRSTAERLDQREQEFATLRDAQAAAEHVLHACQRRLAETERVLEAGARRDRALERLTHEFERIEPSVRELHVRLAALLPDAERGAEPPADADGLLAALHRDVTVIAAALQAAERNLGERERWIGLLLQEVSRRRLFPRRLLDHELDLLRRTGQLP